MLPDPRSFGEFPFWVGRAAREGIRFWEGVLDPLTEKIEEFVAWYDLDKMRVGVAEAVPGVALGEDPDAAQAKREDVC